MTSVGWANLYICANVLLVLAAAVLAAIDRFGGMLPRPVAFRHRLALGRLLLVAAVLLPLTVLVFDHESPLPQTALVWSAPTMDGGSAAQQKDQRIAVAVSPRGTSMSLATAMGFATTLVLVGFLASLFALSRDFRVTWRIVTRAETVRCRGRLSIRASEDVQVPFSFWWPPRCFIVVPSALLLQPDDLKMAIRHEAQHHRQHDTKWLYCYRLLSALFFWNPAIHRIEKRLRSIQEFACDEALSTRRSIIDADYCHSLLRIAETAVSPGRAPIRVNMVDNASASLLKLRIQAVLERPGHHQRWLAVVGSGGIAMTLLAMAAIGCSSTIQDRRISMRDATRMVTVARENSGFPIAVNDRILRQINLLVATPDGRRYSQASLDRMQNYESLIAGELGGRGLPAELMAIPLVESGYRNRDPNGDSRQGAGLWMFIEPTAKRYGLTVTATRDDRLDVAAQSRAAAQYLTELHRQFGDWNLAILAYNAGATRVEKGIQATGSRDAWQIVDQGFENDRDYLPRVIAAILVMKNPAVLGERNTDDRL